MRDFPPQRSQNLAQRAMELRSLRLPGAKISIRSGRELNYFFQVSPSPFGRVYECLLRMKADARMPDVLVLQPDLLVLAGSTPPPHIYRHKEAGTKLCLWWPKQREWVPQMHLIDTFIPWTCEWLWYFEDWLVTGEWSGGGEHPKDNGRRR